MYSAVSADNSQYASDGAKVGVSEAAVRRSQAGWSSHRQIRGWCVGGGPRAVPTGRLGPRQASVASDTN